MLRVRVPASTANMGPGFDCLGLALSLYLEITAEPSSKWTLELQGEGAASLPRDNRNLIVRVANATAESAGVALQPMRLRVVNAIPPSRGLGSSAAAITAGIALVEGYIGEEFALKDFFKYARVFENHADNLSAARLGGFTLCCEDRAEILAIRHDWPERVRAVVIIPTFELDTQRSRSALPDHYSRTDAVFNLQHALLLQSAILKGRLDLLPPAMQDRFHQPHRAALVPGLREALELRMPGLLATALSGSGPTLIAFVVENDALIANALQEVFNLHQISSQTRILNIDTEGRKLS